MRQALRARELVRAMVTELVMVTVMTWKAVAAPTHSESKVCGCLQRVSICIKAEGDETETHLCHQYHLSVPHIVRTDPLDGTVDAVESSSKL